MRVILDDAPPDARLSALEPLPPLGLREWAERRVRRDVPPGFRLVVEESTEGESRRGWPVLIVLAKLVDAGDVVVEHRVVVLYRFIHHAGIAELRAPRRFGPGDAPRVERLLDAAPDFSGEIACLADVLEEPPHDHFP